MTDDPRSYDAEPPMPRVFLREPGWRIEVKVGSDRTFCYTIAPGESAYHRLLDGELVFVRGDEKLCLPCAERRGLLSFVPRRLRDRPAEIELEPTGGETEYDVR